MEKIYNKIIWQNQPSTATPLGARLLNQQSNAINTIDDRIVALDTQKLSVEVANTMVKSFHMDTKTGVITVNLLNGTVYTWDLNLEKIPIALSMTADAVLVLETADGESYTADLKKLIDTYVFEDSSTLAFLTSSEEDGRHVTAEVKNGSITEEKLQPNFLADTKTEVAKAKAQADKAEEQALISQSYAVGQSGIREGEATDNSKYYAAQAKGYMDAAQTAAGLVVPHFYIDFSTGCLMSETEADGIEFLIVDGYFRGRTRTA